MFLLVWLKPIFLQEHFTVLTKVSRKANVFYSAAVNPGYQSEATAIFLAKSDFWITTSDFVQFQIFFPPKNYDLQPAQTFLWLCFFKIELYARSTGTGHGFRHSYCHNYPFFMPIQRQLNWPCGSYSQVHGILRNIHAIHYGSSIVTSHGFTNMTMTSDCTEQMDTGTAWTIQ